MNQWRYSVLSAIAAAFVIALVLHGRMPQDPSYHNFADRRVVFGVPNFWNVISSAPFLLIGVSGLRSLRKHPRGAIPELYPAYAVFFAGTMLIAFGSAFYHLRPDNQSLAFDRLPMTLAFMALVAIIIGEHFDARLGRRCLPFLVLLGVASVAWWQLTELSGRGDLRLYILVQFLPLVLIPLVLLLFPSALSNAAFLWGTVAAYAAAKAFEFLDERIYLTSRVLSGHTLKHVTAAAGLCLIVLAIRRRSIIRNDAATRELLCAE